MKKRTFLISHHTDMFRIHESHIFSVAPLILSSNLVGNTVSNNQVILWIEFVIQDIVRYIFDKNNIFS